MTWRSIERDPPPVDTRVLVYWNSGGGYYNPCIAKLQIATGQRDFWQYEPDVVRRDPDEWRALTHPTGGSDESD